MRILLLLLLTVRLAAQVGGEELRKSPNQDWLTYMGDYAAQRHSPLTEINPRAPDWRQSGSGSLPGRAISKQFRWCTRA